MTASLQSGQQSPSSSQECAVAALRDHGTPPALHDGSAKAAAELLAEKYAAIARALSTADGHVPKMLTQKLKEDLEACLLSLPPHQEQDPAQQYCSKEQQYQQVQPREARQQFRKSGHAVLADAAVIATAPSTAQPSVSHENSNSSSGNRANNSQEQQKPAQALDSPESHQTQIVPVFAGQHHQLQQPEPAAQQLPGLQQQQQLEHYSQYTVQERRQGYAVPPPAGVPPAAAAGPVIPQQGANPMKSSYRGLTWDRKDQRWRVRVHYMGKQHHVGRFADEIEAAKHFDSAAFYLFGDKAITNFGIEATKAHNGPVPASIRALLQVNTSNGAVPAGQAAPEAAGTAEHMPHATAAAAGASMHARPDSVPRQQPHQFRQLSMHLAQSTACAPHPGGGVSVGADSRQRQFPHAAVGHRPTSPGHVTHQQQLGMQQHQHIEQDAAARGDSRATGIPAWLSRHVQHMSEPGSKVARTGDAAGPSAAAVQHTASQATGLVDGKAAATAAAVVRPGNELAVGLGQYSMQRLGSSTQETSGLAEHQQALLQAGPDAGCIDEFWAVDISELEGQLSMQLLLLHDQLKHRMASKSGSSGNLQSSQARQRRVRLMKHLLRNIHELQHDLEMDEQQEKVEQRQVQAAAAAAAARDQQQPNDDVAALVAALMALPDTKANDKPSGGERLIGEKRSAPEQAYNTSRASHEVMPSMAAPTTSAAETLTALAAVLGALKQVPRDSSVAGSSGGDLLADLLMARGAAGSASVVTPRQAAADEAYAAFFPCSKH